VTRTSAALAIVLPLAACGSDTTTAPTALDTPMAPPILEWRAEYPVATTDATGSFTVAWTHSFFPSLSEARYRVIGRRFAPATVWSPPAVVEDTRGRSGTGGKTQETA
jgi:hypothetical protein